jgi:hypothetical protein
VKCFLCWMRAKFGRRSSPAEPFELEHELALKFGFLQVGMRGSKWETRCVDSRGNVFLETPFNTYEAARTYYFNMARKVAAIDGLKSVPSPTSPDPEIAF